MKSMFNMMLHCKDINTKRYQGPDREKYIYIKKTDDWIRGIIYKGISM